MVAVKPVARLYVVRVVPVRLLPLTVGYQQLLDVQAKAYPYQRLLPPLPLVLVLPPVLQAWGQRLDRLLAPDAVKVRRVPKHSARTSFVLFAPRPCLLLP